MATPATAISKSNVNTEISSSPAIKRPAPSRANQSTITSMASAEPDQPYIKRLVTSIEASMKKKEYSLALKLSRNALMGQPIEDPSNDPKTLGLFYLHHVTCIFFLPEKGPKDFEECIEICKKALELNADNSTIISLYSYKHDAHLNLQQYDNAYSTNEYYLKCDDLNPDQKAIGFLRKAKLISKKPILEIAIETCDEGLKLNPKSEIKAEFYLLKATIYKKQSNFESLCTICKDTLKISPLKVHTVCSYIELLHSYSQDQVNKEAAQKIADEFYQILQKTSELELKKIDPFSQLRIIKIFNHYSAFKRADDLCKVALTMTTKPKLLYQICFQQGIACEQQSPTQAIQCFAHALKHNPSDEDRKSIISHSIKLSTQMTKNSPHSKEEVK